MATDGNIQSVVATILSRYLRHNRMRCTPEREVILHKLFESKQRCTAKELREALEGDGYHVSQATVYASLKLFAKAGLAQEHRFAGDSTAQYSRILPDTTANRIFLICNECGRVSSVPGDVPSLKQFTARQNSAFAPKYCMIYVYGICYRCQKRQRRLKRENKSINISKT